MKVKLYALNKLRMAIWMTSMAFLSFINYGQAQEGTDVVSVDIDGVMVSSQIQNNDNSVIPCTEVLMQQVTLSNEDTTSITDFEFGIDVRNEGINLSDYPSDWTVNKIGTVYDFVVPSLAAQNNLTVDLEFELDCDITSDGLNHIITNLQRDITSIPLFYSAEPTVLLYSATQQQFLGVLGEELALVSEVRITSGATRNIRLDFLPEQELDVNSIKVNIKEGTDGNEQNFDYNDIVQVLNDDNTQVLHNYLEVDLSFVSDGVWEEGNENLIVSSSYTLITCSPPQQTFSHSTVANFCNEIECSVSDPIDYNGVGAPASTIITAKMELVREGDICLESPGEFAASFSNPVLDPAADVVGTGGKALTNFDIIIDYEVFSFEEVVIKKGNYVSEPIVSLDADNENAVSGYVSAFPQQTSLISTLSNKGAKRLVLRFNFLDDDVNIGLGEPDDVTGTPWENIFTTLYTVENVEGSGLPNALVEGEGFSLVFKNVSLGSEENVKTCGIKSGGISDFAVISSHLYRDMCGNIPERPIRFGRENPSDPHSIGITGHHPNDNSIYWDGALGMNGNVADVNGNPIEGVDLEENAKVQLTFDIFEENLQFPTSTDPDRTFGATEYNPWDFNLDIFGDDSSIEYWAYVNLPDGLIIDETTANEVSFEYSILDEDGFRAVDENGSPFRYSVPLANQIPLSLSLTEARDKKIEDHRTLFAFKLEVPGQEIYNVRNITTACTGL